MRNLLVESLQEGVMSCLVSFLAKCPFYKHYDAHKIVCEGVQEDSSIHMTFGQVSDRKDYEKARCHGDYKKCPVAQMLYRLYGEDVK